MELSSSGDAIGAVAALIPSATLVVAAVVVLAAVRNATVDTSSALLIVVAIPVFARAAIRLASGSDGDDVEPPPTRG
jgi:1,4-dihydroxy-2-naphthoate octaprenyltransferase